MIIQHQYSRMNRPLTNRDCPKADNWPGYGDHAKLFSGYGTLASSCILSVWKHDTAEASSFDGELKILCPDRGDYSQLTTHYLTTHYSSLTTHNSQLTTHNSHLTTHYSHLTTHGQPSVFIIPKSYILLPFHLSLMTSHKKVNPMKPASRNLHNKEMIKHAGSIRPNNS